MNNDLFFQLLQIAIGTRDNLSFTPLKEEWMWAYELAEKQAMVGVCAYGIQKLLNGKPISSDLSDTVLVFCSKDILYQWIGITANIVVTNEKVNKQCVEVQGRLKEAGLKSCILKGQGIASLYQGALDNEQGVTHLGMFRQSGDIDVWVNDSWQKVMVFVNSITPNKEFDSKHAHLNIFPDTPVELHWWPSVSTNPVVRFRMKQFYRSQSSIQCSNTITLSDKSNVITAPDPIFNSVYILLHIYGHFLYEGIGFRQLMDYYFTISSKEVQDKKNEIVKTYKSFGIYRFVKALMFVMKSVFGLRDDKLLLEPDIARGEELLEEIMEGGNFGYAAKENKVSKEGIGERWVRHAKRRFRLIQYNAIGIVCSPYYRIKTEIWKRKVIKMYRIR